MPPAFQWGNEPRSGDQAVCPAHEAFLPTCNKAITGAMRAITSIAARISQIALWPLAMLDAAVKRANRKTLRRAIRDRSRPLFLFALLRFPAVSAGALTWAIFSIHEKTDYPWPILGAALIVTKKVLVLVLYALDEVLRVRKALRVYRRVTAG